MPQLRRWPKDEPPLASGRPLTRSEVYKIVSRRTGVRQADVDLILDAFMATFVDALKHGDTLSFKGIGKFEHLVHYPNLKWDRQTGVYRVRHYGRTFKFVPVPALAAVLDAAVAAERPMETSELLHQTGVMSLERLIENVKRRQTNGERVAEETLPALQEALEAARVREAAFNEDDEPDAAD